VFAVRKSFIVSKSFVVFLGLACFACFPAAANRIAEVQPDRLLIADPSPALRTYLVQSGFAMERTEQLDAIGFTLLTARSPHGVRVEDSLRDLAWRFPAAIVARDDRFDLASDSRLGRGPMAKPEQVLTAIDWQPEDSADATGIRVGVVDSSLDLANPALQGATIVPRAFTSGKTPTREREHGTAIAAMLVGRLSGESVSGLLGGASLFYAQIFRDGDRGPTASSSDFLRAVNWLLQSGVTVINASVTSTSRNDVVSYAAYMLSRQKVVLVAAAGNNGPSAPPVYPAAIPSVFAVTAVWVKGDGYRYANVGDYIDISAPGINLPTTSRRITSGTSLAAPFATAAVARLVQACGVSPVEAEVTLQANARDLGPRGWDSHFGWGLLQAPVPCGGSAAAPQAGLSAADRHP
jgi:subtilisin family serine protease